MNIDRNLVWHHATVNRGRRQELNGHNSVLLWFTGLSGAGKSTLAHALEEQLHQHGCRTFVLDGDNVRHGLCNDLGFSPDDRTENIRRIGEMAKLFIEAGVIALTAFISPYRTDRQRVRELLGQDFVEIYVRCPLEVCEERDVKGLYKKARAGQIPEFTGISSPYEEPDSPELVIDTAGRTVDDCVAELKHFLVEQNIISVTGTRTIPLEEAAPA